MSTNIDPAKLKVVELRQELQARGLDVKGNKPVLVKRLKEALENELQTELPDTSIADTTTEDLNTTVEKSPERELTPEPVPDQPEPSPETQSQENDAAEADQYSEGAQTNEEGKEASEDGSSGPVTEEKQNGDGSSNDESVEPTNRKSRWGDGDEIAEVHTADSVQPMNVADGDKELQQQSATEEDDQRGDKRKYEGGTPERPAQRRRSKSPPKHDEPTIDPSKVQLSWYDSDLQLQIDKETFLSAKPLHDGAFGYIWAGARLSHGIESGKVCYEVKIGEELKFDDILQFPIRIKKDKSRTNKSAEVEKSDSNDEQREEVAKADEEAETQKNVDVKQEEMAEEAVTETTERIEVKVEYDEEIEDVPHNIPSHIIRIGWSVADASLQLGEDKHSYCVESTGKFFNNTELTEHTYSFKTGDIVTSYLDLNNESVSMVFAVNGDIQFTHTVNRSEIEDENFALFPHILTRNLPYEVNVGDRDDRLAPASKSYEDYVFISAIEEKIPGKSGPAKREDCEVIMMIGLPGSGKTDWINQYLESNSNQNYQVISNTEVYKRMSINGKPFQDHVFKLRKQGILDQVVKATNKLCEMAALRTRNFILDQTNVFPSAQRRKMRSFWNFKRHAVIVVNSDEEQERREKLQEKQAGKDVSDSSVLEMKASMSLPRTGEWLQQVTYASLPETEAKTQVQAYNKQGREAGFGNTQRKDYRDDRGGYHNKWRGGYGGYGPQQRRDFRGNYRDRPYGGRFDRGFRQGPGSWRGGSPGGMGWGGRMDRRDARGPPRDWRNNRGDMDRHRGGGGASGNRDQRTQSAGGANYNRNRNQWARNTGGGNWSGGQGGSNWAQNQAGSWNQADWNQGGGWNQGQGNWNQNQWKYGGYGNQGSGYGQYTNWNYYGQYAHNWNAQQGQTTAGTTTGNATTTEAQSYAQMNPQQQAAVWAQYAQQYAQTGQQQK